MLYSIDEKAFAFDQILILCSKVWWLVWLCITSIYSQQHKTRTRQIPKVVANEDGFMVGSNQGEPRIVKECEHVEGQRERKREKMRVGLFAEVGSNELRWMLLQVTRFNDRMIWCTFGVGGWGAHTILWRGTVGSWSWSATTSYPERQETDRQTKTHVHTPIHKQNIT